MAGWVNRSQQDVIEYLRAENRILREQLGGRRLQFSDAQRRLLARADPVLVSLRGPTVQTGKCKRLGSPVRCWSDRPRVFGVGQSPALTAAGLLCRDGRRAAAKKRKFQGPWYVPIFGPVAGRSWDAPGGW